MAYPNENNTYDKEIRESVTYDRLAQDKKLLWALKNVVVVRIIVENLGELSEETAKHMEEIEAAIVVGNLQKITLLGTTRIFRMVLNN